MEESTVGVFSRTLVFSNSLLKYKRIRDAVLSFCFFLIVCLPSLKFFWFGPIPNIVVFVLILVFVLLSFASGEKLSISQRSLICFWLLWFSIFALSFFKSYSSVAIDDYVRIVFVVCSAVFVCLCRNKINEEIVVRYVIAWTLFLCAAYWYGYVVPTGSGDLSYLNFTMQIGLGAMVLLPSISRRPVLSSLAYFFIMLTVFSFPGRTAIISVVVVSFVFFILWGMVNRKLGLFFLFLLFLVASFLFFNFEYFFSEYTLYKFNNLLNGEDPRFLTFYTALEIILTNPFGVGFHQHYELLGFYPHNLFLEIGMAAGILPVLLIFMLIMLSIYKFLKTFSRFINTARGRAVMGLSLSGFYLFIYWNFSFELGSSYALFSLVSLMLITPSRDLLSHK